MPRKSAGPEEPQVVRRVTEELAGPAGAASDEGKLTFWEYMQSLSPKGWERHIVYLTREEPKTGIKGVGGYLTKLTGPFTIEDIKNAFGGYEFSYIMNRDGKIIYSGRFKVEAAPKFDLTREVAGAATGDNNGQGAIVGQFVEVLREELSRAREASNPASEEAIKLLSAASTRAMDIVLKQVPQQGDPMAQLSGLVATAKNLGLVGGNGGGGNLLETVSALKALGLLPDPMQQMTLFFTIFEKLDALRGERGGQRDWKGALIEKVAEAVPRVLDEVGKNRQAQLQIASERAEVVRTLRGIPPSAPKQGATVPADTQPASAGTPGLPTETTESTGDGALATNQALDPNDPYVLGVKRRMVQLFLEGEETDIIIDFLESAVPGFCDDILRYPDETLTGYLGQDPLFAETVRNPRWPVFLSEARAYLTDSGDEKKPN